MIERCKPTNKYGHLGISVCAHWRVFANFLADMGERPDGCEIDRKDSLGNYIKENCQWTPERANRQQRRTVALTETKRAEAKALREQGKSHRQIAAILGVSKSCITGYFTGEAWRERTNP